MRDFQRLFHHILDSGEDTLHDFGGVPEDTFINYISNTFLNGYINYFKVIDAMLLDTSQWYDHKSMTKVLEVFHRQPHSQLNTLSGQKWVLSESKSDFWIFMYDPDPSECSIGRLSKGRYSEGYIKEALKKAIDPEQEYKILDLELKGWISG